jgi:hypothetical protein
MTSFQNMVEPESIPAVAASVPLGADQSGFEWPEYLKTIAELADPMDSAIVKGWLESDLRAPK